MGQISHSFITNEGENTLENKISTLIKSTKQFDMLVGYFYATGFHHIVHLLNDVSKVRILVGMKIDKNLADEYHKASTLFDEHLYTLSSSEVKEIFEKEQKAELYSAPDTIEVEDSLALFREMIISKKLEIKVIKNNKNHAKVYIFTQNKDDIKGEDPGKIITGSSNLTRDGLNNNFEFNVLLRDPRDYHFAKDKFDELWADAIDVSKEFEIVIDNSFIVEQEPYHIYLKTLLEYFKFELENLDRDIIFPNEFEKLKYQNEAVINALNIIKKYNGVFVSDVVGLGKTIVSAVIARELGGRTLVVAPPRLIEEKVKMGWRDTISQLDKSDHLAKMNVDFVSHSKLEDILQNYSDYDNIIVDEAHRFRNMNTRRYELLKEICKGKKVILISATPFNNAPKEIINLIALFSHTTNSNIPGIKNIESFFDNKQKEYKKLKDINKKSEIKEYDGFKTISAEIREKVIKHIMIRRTRTDIKAYYKEDLAKANIKFPELKKPVALLYTFDEIENQLFDDTLQIICDKDMGLNYSRYLTLLYNKDENIVKRVKNSQENLAILMKIQLIKRLDSSFCSFQKSLDNLIRVYNFFIRMYKEEKKVYSSDKHTKKLIEYFEDGDFDKIDELEENQKAEKMDADEFHPNLITDLEKDYNMLINLQARWKKITRDPKIIELKKQLDTNPILKDNKVIIFTEYSDTAKHISKELANYRVITITGDLKDLMINEIRSNFDANSDHKKDDYDILVSTEVLSEGVNLHRANIVVNYDIPWNPTRIIQRAGRVNRINTKFEEIHIFHFFPGERAEKNIKLKTIAIEKMTSFISLLGDDINTLIDDDDVASFDLFERIMQSPEEKEERNVELYYLNQIKNIKKENNELFKKIELISLKSKASKTKNPKMLVSFIKKGKYLKKFIVSDKDNNIEEKVFLDAIKLMECTEQTQKENLKDKELYYKLLENNKNKFYNLEREKEQAAEEINNKNRYINQFINITDKYILLHQNELSKEDKEYIKKAKKQVKEGQELARKIRIIIEKLYKKEEEGISKNEFVNLIRNEIKITNYNNKKQDVEKEKIEVILSMMI